MIAILKPSMTMPTINKIHLPESLTTIGNGAFGNNSSLLEVTFGSGLRSIGHGAFFCCRHLRAVDLPTGLTEIVLGKFLGAFLLFALCSVIFLVYAVVISFFAQPQWSVILCTFVGLMLLGSAFIAINVFISSLTESMIVAAVAGMAIGLLVDMMTYFINAINVDWITAVLEKINFINYYQNFTYGVLSPVDIVFFLSVTALFLFFTVRVLEKRRWS